MSECKWIANPVKAIPEPNKILETVPVTVGPNFSTAFPIKAADIPKQKIAKLNANDTDASLQWVCAMIGFEKTLHA